MKEKQTRARYTPEFKREAVRLVNEGRPLPVTAKVLGIPKATLGNWVRDAAKGTLQGAGDKVVTPEQMETSSAACRARAREDGARQHGRSDGVLRESAGVKYAWIERHGHATSSSGPFEAMACAHR